MEKKISRQTKDYIEDQTDIAAKKVILELEIEQMMRELQKKEAELVYKYDESSL